MRNKNLKQSLIGLLFICSTQVSALTTVHVQLQWKHQFEFAGFYAAIQQGYYRDKGLNVELVEFDETKKPIDQVLSGQAEYGVGYSSLIASYLEGKPLILLANFLKRSPVALVTQPEIQSLQQLKNKTIMGVSDSLDQIALKMMLGNVKLQGDDYISLPPSFSIDEFAQKKVDAMVVFTTNETFDLDKQGIAYKLYDPTVYGAEFYDVNLFTSKAQLKRNPQQVKDFKDASIKGWKYAMANIDEMVELILLSYNSQHKSRLKLQKEADAIRKMMMLDIYPIGSIDKERVLMMASDFINNGIHNTKNSQEILNIIYQDANKAIALNRQEQQFVNQKTVLNYCINSKIALKGPRGMYEDFARLVFERLGLQFKKLSSQKNNNQSCDFMTPMSNDDFISKNFNVSIPYLQLPMVISTKLSSPFISNLGDLENKTVTLRKGQKIVGYLQKNYPKINLKIVNSIKQGLNLVDKRKAFGHIDNIWISSNNIQQRFKSSIKISGRFNETAQFRFAVNKNNPILLELVNKAVLDLKDNEITKVLSKWSPVIEQTFISKKLIIQILLFFLFLFGLYLYRMKTIHQYQLKLKKTIKQRTADIEQQNLMLVNQHKLASLGEMLANIAHQWRQPLNTLNGVFINMDYDHENGKLDASKMNLYLNQCEGLTSYMSNTVRDFTQYFQPQKNKQTFDAVELIQKSISMLQPTLTEAKITMQTKLPKNAVLTSYPPELMQVLFVLINNAKDAFVTNNIKQNRIILITCEVEKEHVIICLKDNAGGINADIINNIFLPYFSTKHKTQGTGLGLYMAKMLLEKSIDGTMSVSSNDSDSQFTLRIKQ